MSKKTTLSSSASMNRNASTASVDSDEAVRMISHGEGCVFQMWVLQLVLLLSARFVVLLLLLLLLLLFFVFSSGGKLLCDCFSCS